MTKAELFASEIKENSAAIIFDEVSRRYLTGFDSSDGVLYITKNAGYLFLDNRYTEMAFSAKKNGLIPAFIEIRTDRPFETIHSINRQEKIDSISYEDHRLTCHELKCLREEFKKNRFVALGCAIEDLRVVKSPDEVNNIKAAQAITDAAFSHILEFLSPERTELEVAAELEYFMRKSGAEGFAFETISVSGVKSSMPHGKPSDVLLTENSFLTMDFGAKYCGYCSDMTRTVSIGKATDEMKKVYDTVLEAQKKGIESVCGGVLGGVVDKAARDYINNAGFGGCFGHSTGHALGLEIHENPGFFKGNDMEIPSGAVLSVEPGIYLDGQFGVRIEDIVLLTDSGCENLTASPKNLIEI